MPYYATGNGQKVCVPSPTSLSKHQVKEMGRGAGKKNARSGKRQGRVGTAKEKRKSIRKAPPTKFPSTLRVVDVSVQVKVPPQRKQPPLVKHAEGVWDSPSPGCDAWTVNPPTRMLIRNEDAASLIRLTQPTRKR